MHGVGSRNKLTPSHARHYPTPCTLDVLGRSICRVGCLPRKELHEAWEMATRVRSTFRGGRVIDLCAGFGLLAQVMLLLDDSSPEAVAVDAWLPQNHAKVFDAVAEAFPRIRGRVSFVQARLEDVALAVDDVVVSSHACGALTDAVLDRATRAGARVAVLPCCHAVRFRTDLAAYTDRALAMDDERIARVREVGYRAWTESIPAEVSPKNRLVLAAPYDDGPALPSGSSQSIAIHS